MEESLQTAPVEDPIKQEEKRKKKEAKDEISVEKLELALYRAQMAMVRTATTMITFGFALYRLLEEKTHDGQPRPVLDIITPRVIALVLFLAGFIGLVTYSIKHVRTLKKIGRLQPSFYYSGIMLITFILIILTVGLFIGTLLNG